MRFQKGHKHSKEVIEKLRQAGLKRAKIGFSLETRHKISEACKGTKNGFYGKKHTLEAIDKMKKNNRGMKGKKHSVETRHKMSISSKGRIFSKEHRLNMSKARKGIARPYARGKNSYLWKGGLTSKNKVIKNSIEYRLWRESVFARDGWTCQKCKVKGGYLHPHHILNFSEWIALRFAIDNGITLCKDCHIAFHKKYGRCKNTREQINNFITSP